MNPLLKALIFCFAVSILAPSCQQDEGIDGPITDVIPGTWDVTSSAGGGSVTFNADGTGISNSVVFDAEIDGQPLTNFTWEASNATNTVTIEHINTNTGSSVAVTYNVEESKTRKVVLSINLFNFIVTLTQ